ncbi:26S proteasome non-ATPase regulatory subunit 13 [Mayamaea pseudoterrestris]|nr:26S proteasome non-ATPase regulatory subunit 13 [Mayamaea pseudoterrestris]
MSSSPSDPATSAMEALQFLSSEHSKHAPFFQSLSNYVEQKHWHQLTVAVLDKLRDSNETALDPEIMLKLLENVLSKLQPQLNVVSYAIIVATVASKLPSVSDSRSVLENCLETVLGEDNHDDENQNYSAAKLYLQSKLVSTTLQQQETQQVSQNTTSTSNDNTAATLASMKMTLQQNAKQLEMMFSSSSSLVHVAHYEASMNYYKLVGPPERFVAECLSYLQYYSDSNDGSSNVSKTSTSDKNKTKNVALAVDLIVAALVGEGVYDLQRILQTSIVQALVENESYTWLVQLLQTCADGNVVHFNALSQTHANDIQQHPALVHGASVVYEKLTLMALVHYIFDKPSNERILSFDEIAARLHVELDQVEWVCMRALSVHLIEGSLDQVSQTLQVTWVLPRVLDQEQTKQLARRFGDWAEKVVSMKEYMQTTVDAAF